VSKRSHLGWRQADPPLQRRIEVFLAAVPHLRRDRFNFGGRAKQRDRARDAHEMDVRRWSETEALFELPAQSAVMRVDRAGELSKRPHFSGIRADQLRGPLRRRARMLGADVSEKPLGPPPKCASRITIVDVSEGGQVFPRRGVA